MEGFIGVVALKSLILILLAVVYYCGIIVPLRWLERKLPPSKIKDFFFKKRFEEMR